MLRFLRSLINILGVSFVPYACVLFLIFLADTEKMTILAVLIQSNLILFILLEITVIFLHAVFFSLRLSKFSDITLKKKIIKELKGYSFETLIFLATSLFFFEMFLVSEILYFGVYCMVFTLFHAVFVFDTSCMFIVRKIKIDKITSKIA